MTDTPAPGADKPVPAPGSDKPDVPMIPKARLDEEIGKRRALETENAEMADAILADIPDNLKSLIPADLGPAAKIKWFREAKKTGVFDAKPDVPETDKGKPATTPKDHDLSTLPAHARIAAGYGKAS
jgi:hypothetical protein